MCRCQAILYIKLFRAAAPPPGPSGSSPAADPSGSSPAADPSGSSPAADPSGSSPAADPSGSSSAADPSGSSPAADPSGSSPAADPSGSSPEADPSGSSPAADPSGSSPAAEDPSNSNSSNKRQPADIGSGLADERAFLFDPATQMGMGLDPGVIQAVSAASGVWREDGCLQGFYGSKLTRSQQLVVFFGNTDIGTRGGWGAKAVLQACRKVVERPDSGEPTGRVPGTVVTVDEFRTSKVSSIINSPQPCEEELDSSKPPRPEDWKPKPGQVQNRLLRSAWSKRFEAPVRGLMWCPWLHQAIPGDLGKWVDRDCNAALQRAGETKWRPLELCRWPHRGRLPAKGKEYPALGFKKLRDRAPKALAQQPVAQ
ncbi:hypothetical protein QJQ45_008529 [Haematococcus lacustris]|nr:hypothetical protein QJQ45_008529 [Haematococcus lacustris]